MTRLICEGLNFVQPGKQGRFAKLGEDRVRHVWSALA